MMAFSAFVARIRLSEVKLQNFADFERVLREEQE